MDGKTTCGGDDPTIPCRREVLRKFVAECDAIHRSVDEVTAIMMIAKLAGAQSPQHIIDIIRHMLADYREILLDQLEQKYGIKTEQ
jgi:hypothetical protein